MRRDRWSLIGVVAFFGLVMLALFGERLAPHESIYFVVQHGDDPRPYDPGVVFPFGSDVLGRDIFSLVLAGARTTLTIVVVSGVARVLAGALVAALSAWWRPMRLATEAIAQLASAVPATLVALVIMKVLIGSDPSVAGTVGALLVTGWAGPYRVIRSEVDRLQKAPFTQGAVAVGVSRWRLLMRHQLPHLVPTLAMNASQQIVASLVLVAELGFLNVFIGTSRMVNVEESLGRLINGQVNFAQIADPPEWGGLLAGARTIESLWLTRWLIFVPGLAFAMTAVAIAAIGFALAQRYSRRDVTDDIRTRGAATIAGCLVALVVVAGLVPERYAEARQWAADARAEILPPADPAASFLSAGLRPVGTDYALRREMRSVVQTGPSSVQVGSVALQEKLPRDTTQLTFNGDVRPLVYAGTGGGIVDAPLVFAGRGIVPSEDPPPVFRTLIGLQSPALGTLLKDYADDYAGIDVRGKVVLLVRFYGFVHRTFDALGAPKTQAFVYGKSVEDSINGAIHRGAAAVVLIDPSLPYYTDEVGYYSFGPRNGPSAGANPYLRIERESPATTTSGAPVVVVSARVAAALTTPLGLDLSGLYDYDTAGVLDKKRSMARDLGVHARVEVPLQAQARATTSYVGEVDGAAIDGAHVLVWAIRTGEQPAASSAALVAVARAVAPRKASFLFVDFDASLDPRASTKAITDLLQSRRITLVVVLKDLTGSSLRFITPAGELIPALDIYAQKSGAASVTTRDTAPIAQLSDIAPLIQVKTVVLTGDGDGDGDLAPDAAAMLGYLAGRFALGAEELPR